MNSNNDSKSLINSRSIRSLNTNKSNYSSQISISNPYNKNQINLINDTIRNISNNPENKFENSIHTSSQNYSIPSNFQGFESLMDDMRNNVVDIRRRNFEENNIILQNLINSINYLNEQIILCKKENEMTLESIKDLNKKNDEIKMEINRIQNENFHNNIEILFLKKKIEEKEKELNDIQKNNRDMHYDTFKNMASSLTSKNYTKLDKKEVDKLIEEKKCLNTAIILMNKKINNLKKELATKIYKGEVFMNEFGKLVNREMIDNDF